MREIQSVQIDGYVPAAIYKAGASLRTLVDLASSLETAFGRSMHELAESVGRIPHHVKIEQETLHERMSLLSDCIPSFKTMSGIINASAQAADADHPWQIFRDVVQRINHYFLVIALSSHKTEQIHSHIKDLPKKEYPPKVANAIGFSTIFALTEGLPLKCGATVQQLAQGIPLPVPVIPKRSAWRASRAASASVK